MIYVCKYRKLLFIDKNIINTVKILSNKICQKHNVNIKYVETDKDHIHYMIETRPNINLSNFIKIMKSYITYHMWELHKFYLQEYFWKEKILFSDSYFICSIGNVSENTLK